MNLTICTMISVFFLFKPRLSRSQQLVWEAEPVDFIDDFALIGKTYQTIVTIDYPTCLLECMKEERCMSINFDIVKLECELNSQTKESRPELYKKRTNSIYSNNIDHRIPDPRKGTKESPAKSCLDILQSGESMGTGDGYWIDPAKAGTPIQVFCDMTTDGGGWTIIKRLVLAKPGVPPSRSLSTAYEVMSSYASNTANILIPGGAMSEIFKKMGFHQMHFYCYKKSVGRVVSIVTKNDTVGQQVVRFFTDNAWASKNYPDACGSFDTLYQDNSNISQTCTLWGRKQNGAWRVNKWGYFDFYGSNRLNTRPITSDKNMYVYGFSTRSNQGHCDDSVEAAKPHNIGDKWQISVR